MFSANEVIDNMMNRPKQVKVTVLKQASGCFPEVDTLPEG